MSALGEILVRNKLLIAAICLLVVLLIGWLLPDKSIADETDAGEPPPGGAA